ncbi:DedA family protein [Chryseosolibacter indicus]|uniref:VTT domain-containing protein n=1 Tax=Chryseosolibacter indicus TaxID=2782351 RepID=A0ABS5VVV4_9BACT|nr:VTT domain-containing protein [Chryseosolibacter indicus]MBT1704947.1 VTT domain-containing protein [Chryseosolibacter indicus]
MNILVLLESINPENIIQYGGLGLLLLIIFAETGVFFGFFLPGDSLLFVAGLLSDTEYLDMHVGLMIVLLIIAAVSGSTVGYLTGRWAGAYLANKKDSIFFKKKYLDLTQAFYLKHGMMAFILGRFLPVVRTFVTILAGMVKIDFPKFVVFNFLGASIWIVTMVLAGHFLGRLFPGITEYLEFIVIGMVLISAIPVIMTYLKNRKLLAKE